jgi:cell division septation protein DedD
MAKKRKKQKKYKIELTTFWAFFWAGSLFFILVWIFTLGILVGRGFLPGTVSTISDLKNQVKKLQEMVGKKEEYKDIQSADQGKDPELDFYEKLNTKKDEVKRTNIPEKKEKPPGEITLFKDPPEKKTTDEVKEKAVTGTVEEEEKVTVQEETPAKTEELSVKPPPAQGSTQQYTVQIASLPEKEKAEKLITTLVEEGYDAYYYTAEVNGKNYYRVRCGRFPSRKEAFEYSKKLETETGYKGFVSRVE